MSLEKVLEIEGGTLTYKISGREVSVITCRVQEGRAVIPDCIEGFPVTKLEKKAFLSSKQLKEVFLPETIEEIGDWAFGYCSNLEKVWLPRKSLSFGRGIFKDCGRLFEIGILGEEGAEAKQTGRLLGAIPMKLEADYLFTLKEAGSAYWLSRFDDRLKEFLEAPDEDGYAKMVYCGEEDIVANMDFYLAERRRAKARLCFLRLMNDLELSEDFRKELASYLTAHTKGCDSEAAWEVVFKEHGNEQEYYEAFAKAGCLTEANYDDILARMGEQYPEMKGYLMRYKSQSMDGADFFDMLSL